MRATEVGWMRSGTQGRRAGPGIRSCALLPILRI